MTRSPPLLVLSHHGDVPQPFRPLVEAGRLAAAWEWDLDPADIAAADGILLTMHLDQTRAVTWADAFEAMLDRGGRILVNGHIALPFLAGLAPFVLAGRKRDDYRLTILGDHPIFAGVDRLGLEERRGVAGFYGRGHNPLPEGARALTGIGRAAAPLDWVWRRPGGGTILCHAGNDLWISPVDPAGMDRLAANAVGWLAAEMEA